MIYYIYPHGVDLMDYPEPNGKFVLSFQTTDGAVKFFQSMLKSVDIYLKYSNVGKIYFNSRKARDFFADYLEEEFFMTFCNYEGRPNQCYFCGRESCIKCSNSKFKLKYILLCLDCDKKLSRLLK